jgi:hypothetical protein
VLKTLPLLLQVSVGGKDLFAAPVKIPVDAGPTNSLYSLVSGDGIQGGSLRGAMLSKVFAFAAQFTCSTSTLVHVLTHDAHVFFSPPLLKTLMIEARDEYDNRC